MEWYNAGWGGNKCFAIAKGQVATKAAKGRRWRDATCYVKALGKNFKSQIWTFKSPDLDFFKEKGKEKEYNLHMGQVYLLVGQVYLLVGQVYLLVGLASPTQACAFCPWSCTSDVGWGITWRIYHK